MVRCYLPGSWQAEETADSRLYKKHSRQEGLSLLPFANDMCDSIRAKQSQIDGV